MPSKVDFPAPSGPIIPTIFPAGISKLTLSSATTARYRWVTNSMWAIAVLSSFIGCLIHAAGRAKQRLDKAAPMQRQVYRFSPPRGERAGGPDRRVHGRETSIYHARFLSLRPLG